MNITHGILLVSVLTLLIEGSSLVSPLRRSAPDSYTFAYSLIGPIVAIMSASNKPYENQETRRPVPSTKPEALFEMETLLTYNNFACVSFSITKLWFCSNVLASLMH